LTIIAGPNGAGKTSFANKQFEVPKAGLYLNADEIARSLADARLAQGELNFRAGREMLREIDKLVDADASFVFETTLASLTYARKILNWRQRGYTVVLIYLRLPNVEISIERVQRRVAQGGHNIPEEVIRQRFAKSYDYFEKYYKSIVDEWYVWDSLEGEFRPAESWKN
jgi:predicted ABC-type ATPase